MASNPSPVTSLPITGGTLTGNLTVQGNITATLGNIDASFAGTGLRVSEGANGKQGRATLVAGTVTVADTSTTAASEILVTSQVDGGTPGFLRVSGRTAGTSFTITSGSGTDTSTAAFEMFEPG